MDGRDSRHSDSDWRAWVHAGGLNVGDALPLFVVSRMRWNLGTTIFFRDSISWQHDSVKTDRSQCVPPEHSCVFTFREPRECTLKLVVVADSALDVGSLLHHVAATIPSTQLVGCG